MHRCDCRCSGVPASTNAAAATPKFDRSYPPRDSGFPTVQHRKTSRPAPQKMLLPAVEDAEKSRTMINRRRISDVPPFTDLAKRYTSPHVGGCVSFRSDGSRGMPGGRLREAFRRVVLADALPKNVAPWERRPRRKWECRETQKSYSGTRENPKFRKPGTCDRRLPKIAACHESIQSFWGPRETLCSRRSGIRFSFI